MRRYNTISIGEISKKIEVRQRHFDLWEAQEIIPKLEFYVRELQDEKRKISSLTDVLNRCCSADAEKEFLADPICNNLKFKLKHQCSEYISFLEKIAEMGVIVDDLDIMSFDFYSWLDGEEVLLCWQSGEKNVGYWHYPEENFSNRRVLDVIDIMSTDDEELLLH